MAGQASAEVNGITPDPKPVLGNTLTCKALDDGNLPRVASWAWVVYGYQKGCQWPVACNSTQPGIMTFPLGMPAQYQVGCVVTYGQPNPPPRKQLAPVVMTVAEPKDVRIVTGNGVVVNCATANQMRFQVLDAGGNVCGGYLTGLAQERLYNTVDWWGQHQPDVDWRPASPVDTFKIQAGLILDTQAVGVGSWSNISVGATFTFDQDLRIHYLYPDGTTTLDCSLGTVHYVYTKVDQDNWRIDATH
jgi:hypothetical protein